VRDVDDQAGAPAGSVQHEDAERQAGPHAQPDRALPLEAAGPCDVPEGAVAGRVEELARLGGFDRLRDLGVPEDDLALVAAEAAARPGALANPRHAEPDDVLGLLRAIW